MSPSKTNKEFTLLPIDTNFRYYS